MLVSSGGGGGAGSGIEVDLTAMDTIAGKLDSGAEGLDGLAGSVPSGVDAGPMTAYITGMLAQATSDAGTVSEALSASAAAVRAARTYYQRTDADVDATMGEIGKAMKP